MDQIIKTVQLFIAIFLALTIVQNLNSRIIRLPFEPYLNKYGFALYFPVFTSMVLSILITVTLNYFTPAK